jgi:hypothetical protein
MAESSHLAFYQRPRRSTIFGCGFAALCSLCLLADIEGAQEATEETETEQKVTENF